MPNPTLRIRPPIQRRALDILGLIRRVKVLHFDNRPPAIPRAQPHFAEEGRGEEVDVLACDGEETHHGEAAKGAHGAVVVAGDAGEGGVEEGGDVSVHPVGAQRRATCVVELEHGQEGLLVAHVEKTAFVEVLEALGEELDAAHRGDERGHVLGYVEGV